MTREISQKRTFTRSDLLAMQDLLLQTQDCHINDTPRCPLKHTFSDGIYVREIFIPAGTPIVGKIHKHDHPNFLMSGIVRVITEEGMRELTGPCYMISPAGTKRALVALTDLVWVTIHANPSNTQDLKELENNIISPSYEDFDKFIKLKNKPIRSLFNSIKRRLLCHG